MIDPISETVIQAELRKLAGNSASLGLRFEIREETVSTNDNATKAGSRGELDGLVIVADHQTNGRGRRENRWESPPGKNLMFSIVLRPTEPIDQWTRIPHLIGLAVARGIESAIPGIQEIELKWPNDLMFLDRKLGGMLVESRISQDSSGSFCAVGVGLNVNIRPAEFPDDVREIAASLFEKTDRVLSRSILLAHILAEWIAIYPASISNFESAKQAIESRSFLNGRAVEVHTGSEIVTGLAKSIGPDGELLVQTSEKTVEIRSAERVRRVDSEASCR